jgi:type IV pilus assembly protein PilA
MVVLLVLAILLAIAIPTFLGTTASATSRSAQANLNTAFTDAKTQYENDN